MSGEHGAENTGATEGAPIDGPSPDAPSPVPVRSAHREVRPGKDYRGIHFDAQDLEHWASLLEWQIKSRRSSIVLGQPLLPADPSSPTGHTDR